MSGIIGTLRYKPAETQVTQENGYVHIANITGGSLNDVDSQNPDGQWTIHLSYYLSIADFQSDPSSFVMLNDTNVPQYFRVPYVPNSGPVQSALVVLQEWWPDGTVVP